MKSIHCIIVDDEPHARGRLEKFIKEDGRITLVGSYKNATEAFEGIAIKRPELILLDIKMPGINGFQLLPSLTPTPLIVFTTGYAEYAVEAFKVNAVDYLLKPIEYDRFLQAIGKVIIILGNPDIYSFSITIKGKDVKIFVKDILYVESLNEKLQYVTDWGILSTYESLKDRIDYLDKRIPRKFCRTHRSYIVSLQRVDFVDGDRVFIGKEIIPIGRAFKEEFMKKREDFLSQCP